jgi:hypothetical protein
MLLFHRKHYRNKYPWIVNGLVVAGVAVKFGLTLLRNIFRHVG